MKGLNSSDPTTLLAGGMAMLQLMRSSRKREKGALFFQGDADRTALVRAMAAEGSPVAGAGWGFLLRLIMVGASLLLASLTARGDDACRDLLKHFEEGGVQGAEIDFDGSSTQPMTVALLLRAQMVVGQKEQQSWDRARASVDWLIAHCDDDHAGEPGWGLPDAWDAFGDGKVNPANQPYRITTALVAEALLDACAVSGVMRPVAREKILNLLTYLFKTWSARYVSRGKRTYYWYSISATDAQFVPNVSAYFAGVARFGTIKDADQFVAVLDRDYAQPRYRITPQADSRLHPRQLAHAHWGLSEMENRYAGR